ncbi:phage major capsid protein [Planctomicrobium sp. SH664]|uniref:phage major capsid protein n=1 Tax=Planctomicrobium sp. SH664 TaxID=3448125 RepID=UPI003F5B8D57
MHGTSLKSLIESQGSAGFYHKVVELLNERKLTPDDFSYHELADACGVLPRLRSLRESSLLLDRPLSSADAVNQVLQESNPGLGSHLFQIVTGELIGRKVLEGYDDDSGFIGDKLVTVIPSRYRNTRIAGFRALSGPTEVAEGHPYEESSFEEKYVTSQESKQGRILSINEELIAFDQTGEIHRRAMALGYALRQERERTIVRACTDADSSAGRYVYRPAGVGKALYLSNGSHRNYIGSGNTTSSSFNAAVALENWTDIETALYYRATQVLDDRTDGSPRPVVVPAKQLLVPEKLRGTARSIIHSTEIQVSTDAGETHVANPVHNMLEVLSSPFIDEQGGAATSSWYLGDFKRQFLWTEIWPVQTFLQRTESAAAFDRDVVLRVKARYFGGVSAVDTAFVTKVTGA